MRLLWVVPRFGEETVGGAERLVRELATRAMPAGWRSEVATTCARNHYTWDNELEPGEYTDGDTVVRRFLVGPRDSARYDELHQAIAAGEADYATELEWLAHSVWAPDLQTYIATRGGDYDLILFSPYFFGTTIWGAQVRLERSALVPCLHDEAYARLATVHRVLEAVQGCLFNAPAEERLAHSLCRIRNGGVVGMGFDPPTGPPEADFAAPRGLGQYLLYAGRIEEGKRVHVAVDYVVRYAAERRDAPRLVLIGSGTYEPPEEAADIVLRAGFLSSEEKRAAYAEALALVNPSHLESLSIVLMESWLERTPALVAFRSPVLREHCEAAGAGFTFDSYEEFRDALDELRDDSARAGQMGEAGREYVLDRYGWPSVRERFRSTVEELVA